MSSSVTNEELEMLNQLLPGESDRNSVLAFIAFTQVKTTRKDSLENKKLEHEHKERMFKAIIFVAVIIGVFAVISVVLFMYRGKPELLELLERVIYALLGAAGGFGVGKATGDKKTQPSPENG